MNQISTNCTCNNITKSPIEKLVILQLSRAGQLGADVRHVRHRVPQHEDQEGLVPLLPPQQEPPPVRLHLHHPAPLPRIVVVSQLVRMHRRKFV